MRAIRLPLLAGVLALVPHLTSTAMAATPPTFDLRAEAVCQDTVLRIAYVVTADQGNLDVAVSFNSNEVASYQMLTPPYTISDVRNAPGNPGDSVIVTVLFRGQWEWAGEGGESASTTVYLPTNCTPTQPGSGRFTGGGKSIDTATGLKVTKGFTIHCDLRLSNNLEINWPGTGSRTNQFHMLQHTSARCTDDPGIDQRPPVAPVDRIDGVGTGRFNGEAGYTVFFTLIDAGEPGRSDMIGFQVVGPTGAVVLNLPLQNIVGGNVQAHYDQPHRR